MPEPQPGAEPPAAETRPPGPAPGTAKHGEPAPKVPARADQPTLVDRTGGAGDEQTDAVAPRWTGSAAVPPPGPKKRRWLGRDVEPPPRDPTLQPPAEEREEPSVEEREDLESPTPVDPWADADLWGPHGPPYPPVTSLPQTLPYPAAPPLPPQAVPPPGPRQPEPVPPARHGRRERPEQPPAYGPQPPPPGWRPPPGYVAVAVRRRRRWPRVMLVLTVLTVACCCGIPLYVAKPMWEQYPATADLPARVADLRLDRDSASEQAAQRLERETRAAHLLAEDTFAGVYQAPGGKRVTIFGTTGFRLSPEEDVNAEMTRLTTDYGLTGVRVIETDTRGEYQSCGTGRLHGDAVVVCAWADHGSLAAALFTRLSVEDSARLLEELRGTIVRRG